jgi:methylmalonyl-CoA/ethylmalonyl-CoA epimerase
MKFHHIGFATKNIDASLTSFQKLGHVALTDIIIDELQGVKLCFLSLTDGTTLELVAPASETSPVHKYISKNGNIPYHFCYQVDNLAETISDLTKQRYILVSKPTPAIAFQHRLVAFLYHPNTGLIELLEA